MKVITTVCISKIFVRDKWVILAPKMAHPHKLDNFKFKVLQNEKLGQFNLFSL